MENKTGIPYTKPYERGTVHDNDGPFRDLEEKEYEDARRKGNVMNLVKKDAEEAMAKLFAEPASVAEKKPVAKKAVAKKTAKKAAKKSANRKR